jgi:hypothetical protein
MSSHWTLYCATHDKYGPDIIQTSRVYLSGNWPRFHNVMTVDDLKSEVVEKRWYDFLRDHEYCDLRLVHE